MFDSLSSRLQGIFTGLKSKGRLTEEDINVAMREIRLALLEADVNFKVVKNFVNSAKQRCLTSEVMDSLTPAQNVVKIVLDELTNTLGQTKVKLNLGTKIPSVIMLVGLQGCGKTTAAAKLAYLLKQQNHNPLLAACDVYRPAAIDQLKVLGAEIGVRVYSSNDSDPVVIAKDAVRDAIDNLCDVVIIDTAGRLQINEAMMQETIDIKEATNPDEILMVVDAMTGQDIVNVANEFAVRVDFDGVIMAKMDGDARGGGALSIREATGKPIKFISSGEKPDSLEEFHPDRMAKRILGMGDIVGIIEQATKIQDEEIKQEEAERIARAEINLNDFVSMNQQINKMGGISKLISSLPGGDKNLASGGVDEHALDRMVVIINSMTKEERAKPSILNGARRQRIANGAGVKVSDVNQLMKNFNETRRNIKKMFGDLGQYSNSKGKKGKKKKRSSRRSIPGMSGLSMSDIKKIQQMMDMK